jgi:hypothetical protein
MKSIAAVVAAALLAVSAGAQGLDERLESKSLSQNAWPNIKYNSTFKMSYSLFNWNGYSLNSYYGSNATTLVDAYRNKIITHGKVRLDDYGLVDVTVLQDFNTNYQTTFVPFASECDRDFMDDADYNFGRNLTTLLNRLFREDGGFTRYVGTSNAPWDRNGTFHKFQVRDDYTDDRMELYFRTSDLNIEWIYYNDDSHAVVRIPRGFEPASFSDSDFTIKGCRTYDSLAAKVLQAKRREHPTSKASVSKAARMVFSDLMNKSTKRHQ